MSVTYDDYVMCTLTVSSLGLEKGVHVHQGRRVLSLCFSIWAMYGL